MAATIAATRPPQAPRKRAKRKKIPEYLVKEVLDGIPIYYKGYREVLAGKKTLQDIMGCSGLQSVIVSTLHAFLFTVLRKKYWVLTNEPGNHLELRNNVSYDISIYDKRVLTADKFDRHYLKLPPKVFIEVDIEFEVEDQLSEFEYLQRKTENLLNRGTERVIWFFTATQKVMVCENGKDWLMSGWNKTIAVVDDASVNLVDLMREEGVNLDVLLGGEDTAFR